MCVDLYINGNANGFAIVGTSCITVGKLLIDNINIDDWFININTHGYFNFDENNKTLIEPLLPMENNLCPSHKLRLYKRSYDKPLIMLLGIVCLNCADYTSKINIKRESDIIGFLFLSSIIETSIIGVFYYNVIQHYDKIEYIDAIQKPKVSFIVINVLEVLKSYSYIYSISFAPNIGYAKSIMTVWMIGNEILLGIYKSHFHPDDDVILLGLMLMIQGCVFILPLYL